MGFNTPSTPTSRTLYWTGWVLSILPALMLTMSGIMKLVKPPAVVEGIEKFGYKEGILLGLAVAELLSTVLYLIPQTAVLGAILLTGYLGGAIATHVRIDDIQFITPAVLGVVIWLGLYLRDARLRELLPLRK